MNPLIEMMNQSVGRLREISEGKFNEFVMKGDRRIFRLEVELLKAALRTYRAASKNKKMVAAFQGVKLMDGASLADAGLDDSKIEGVTEQVIDKMNQSRELMKIINKEYSTVELEAAYRELQLQIEVFKTVARAHKVVSKNKGGKADHQ